MLSPGDVEHGTGRSFLVEVPDRTHEMLEGIVTEWVQPGTRIMYDGWVSYYNLKIIHGGIYSHDVVIHKCHFVDPEDPTIHTQNVENK